MRLLAAALLLALPALCVATDVQVHVQRHGGTVVIDVETTVEAPLAVAWSVFTDYDHMTAFLASLRESRVIARNGNLLEVQQSGETRIMFLKFGFKAVRLVELVPMHEIRSGLVSGDFKTWVSTTRFTPTGTGVHISHHGEYAPKAWLPPGIGPMVIAAETRKQYLQFIAEIARRTAATPKTP
jgi:hypothetical protein